MTYRRGRRCWRLPSVSITVSIINFLAFQINIFQQKKAYVMPSTPWCSICRHWSCRLYIQYGLTRVGALVGTGVGLDVGACETRSNSIAAIYTTLYWFYSMSHVTTCILWITCVLDHEAVKPLELTEPSEENFTSMMPLVEERVLVLEYEPDIWSSNTFR